MKKYRQGCRNFAQCGWNHVWERFWQPCLCGFLFLLIPEIGFFFQLNISCFKDRILPSLFLCPVVFQQRSAGLAIRKIIGTLMTAISPIRTSARFHTVWKICLCAEKDGNEAGDNGKDSKEQDLFLNKQNVGFCIIVFPTRLVNAKAKWMPW